MRLIFCALIALLIAGCDREPKVVAPPKAAAAVVTPFLAELRAGDKDGAALLVSPAATDELDAQFAADHKKLAAAPKLTPRFITRQASPAHGAGDEVTLVYAAQDKGKWTSATVRVYRYRSEAYKVEYWRVNNRPPVQMSNSGFNAEYNAQRQRIMQWIFVGLGALAVLAVMLFIWLLRRQRQMAVSDDPAETRRSAMTVRD